MINALFTVALFELFLGGGGRLLEVGPGTVRMALFAPIAIIGFFALVAVPRITTGQRLALVFVIAYLAVHLSALLIGSLHSRDMSDLLGDLQQSLYWLAAPFFALVLQSPRMVRRSATIVEISGVLLALAYLGVLAGAFLGVIDFISLYERLNTSGEFVSRGEGLFVYKGFLYLGIGIIFLVGIRGRMWRSLTVLVTTALILTLTRGFLLATSFAVLLMLLSQGRKATLVAGLVVAVAGGFMVWQFLPSQSQGGTEARFEQSNNQRIVDTTYIADNIRPETYLVGEGLGATINDRPTIENTFLSVFWKMGLPGVLFWLSPLVVCTHFFRKVRGDEAAQRLANAYYFGALLVYVQTMTNPYLNNPIGLSYVMVAMFSLQTLARTGGGPAFSPAALQAPGSAQVVPG